MREGRQPHQQRFMNTGHIFSPYLEDDTTIVFEKKVLWHLARKRGTADEFHLYQGFPALAVHDYTLAAWQVYQKLEALLHKQANWKIWEN